jgi:tetratricopeptide (TPR) repeat protein
LDAATGVGQAEAALLLVDQTLVSAMAQEELDLKAVATLQYAQGTLGSEERDRPVTDAQAMMATLAGERRVARRGALGVLDALATGIQQTVTRATLLPRQVGPKKDPEEISQKLRQGYEHQQAQRFDEAQRLYREVLQETRDPKEATVARELLARLDQARQQRRSAEELERKAALLGSGPEMQRMQFELGSIWLQLYAMEKAAQAFRQAALADPEGEMALPSLFKEAWCLRYLGKFQEAFSVFQEIIQRAPKSSWATASRQQMAEAYKATGDFKKAMQTYEQLVAESQDPALTALALAQAGSMALYDLKDNDKARALFEKVATQFPASSASSIEKDISRLETMKAALTAGAARPLVPGAPVFGWIERTLPAFAQTFAERLARYIESVRETKVTRKYTEKEFREHVLRRVQERFPGQIRAVSVAIRPEGYVGSCIAQLGPVSFPLEGRLEIHVVEERPHIAIPEMRIWRIPVPEGVRQQLAQRVNKTIDGLRLPLKVTQYDFGEGFVTITAEVIRQPTASKEEKDDEGVSLE